MSYLKSTHVLFALAVSGAMIAASPAIAQKRSDGPRLSPAEAFAAMDVDGDELVSEAEFVAYGTTVHDAPEDRSRARFAQISGEDEMVSLAELEAAHPGKGRKRPPRR